MKKKKQIHIFGMKTSVSFKIVGKKYVETASSRWGNFHRIFICDYFSSGLTGDSRSKVKILKGKSAHARAHKGDPRTAYEGTFVHYSSPTVQYVYTFTAVHVAADALIKAVEPRTPARAIFCETIIFETHVALQRAG